MLCERRSFRLLGRFVLLQWHRVPAGFGFALVKRIVRRGRGRGEFHEPSFTLQCDKLDVVLVS